MARPRIDGIAVLVLGIAIGAAAVGWVARGVVSTPTRVPRGGSEASLRVGPTSSGLEPARVEAYHSPSVTSRIVGGTTGDGVLYLYEVDPKTRYSVVIEGRHRSGAATLRIRTDDGEPTYERAPDRRSSRILAGTERVELLIYSDEPFEYDLITLSVDEVPTDRDLKQRILDDVPELSARLRTDSLESARLILDWTANHLDQTSSPVIDGYTYPRVSEGTASEVYYEIFEPDQGAVFCGGMSVYFDKILRLFDLPSFTINFGQLDDFLTHVTVMVENEETGEFHLFDPTFNLTFRSIDGSLLSLDEVFQRSEGEVVVDERPVPGREFLRLDSVAKARTREDKLAARDAAQRSLEAGGEIVFSTYERPGYGSQSYFDQWTGAFERNGLTPDARGFIALLRMRVFSTGPLPSAGTGSRFRSFLEGHGIPFGMPD